MRIRNTGEKRPLNNWEHFDGGSKNCKTSWCPLQCQYVSENLLTEFWAVSTRTSYAKYILCALCNGRQTVTVERALLSSVADPERFDADPDPTLQADADPNPFTRVREIFFFNLHLLFPKSSKTCHV